MDSRVLPSVGALVSWKDMVGHVCDGEVLRMYQDECNGQQWVVVKMQGASEHTMTRDADWICVINP